MNGTMVPPMNILKTSIYLSVCIFQLVPYVIILWIIYVDKKNYGTPVYKIIFHLGISDCIQLIFHSTPLIFTIFQTSQNNLAIKICGAFLNGSYYSFINFTFLLAVDRFLILCFHPLTVQFFEEKVLKIWITLTWLWGCFATIMFLSPITGVLYAIDTLSWSYSPEGFGANMPVIELTLDATQLILGSICYLLTIVKILIIKNTYQTKKDLKYEIKLLFQAIMIGLVSVFICTYWNILYNYVDESYSGFVGNLLWIIESGMNPFIYLTMNDRIRRSFLSFLSLRPKSTTHTSRIFTNPNANKNIMIQTKVRSSSNLN